MFDLLWGTEGFCGRNGFSAHQQLGSRGWKKKKTIHYLVQTPVVQIVHSAVIQQQKCAVNAGKQRNWGVTYNERHLRRGGGGTVALGWEGWGGGCGVEGEQIQQHFLKTLQQLWRKTRNLFPEWKKKTIVILTLWNKVSRKCDLRQSAQIEGRKKQDKLMGI